MNPLKSYYARGKLLLTGEYAVLNGALALAFPTKKGQWLDIFSTNVQGLQWESRNHQGEVWFNALFSSQLSIIQTSNAEISSTLQAVLKACVNQNPDFLFELSGKKAVTRLEFHREWGLGSSSTLVHLLSQWANINPYMILEQTFGGSGYDLACAEAASPITFCRNGSKIVVRAVTIDWAWEGDMYLVYLGSKQVSKNEIAKYSKLNFDKEKWITEISEISRQILNCTTREPFIQALEKHELLISEILGYPTVKSQLFTNIRGTFKSLGAWGGDFVLFVGNYDQIPKIKECGFHTIIPWKELCIANTNLKPY